MFWFYFNEVSRTRTPTFCDENVGCLDCVGAVLVPWSWIREDGLWYGLGAVSASDHGVLGRSREYRDTGEWVLAGVGRGDTLGVGDSTMQFCSSCLTPNSEARLLTQPLDAKYQCLAALYSDYSFSTSRLQKGRSLTSIHALYGLIPITWFTILNRFIW